MTSYLSDDEMRAGLATTKPYTAVILYAGPAYDAPEAQSIIWEHGRRNFALRADGVLNVVCPVLDETDVCGIGIYNLDVDAAKAVAEEDPAVKAGVFTYRAHPVRSFPGDRLA